MVQIEFKSKPPFWQPALVIFTQVTGWIAAPIIIALFLGKYLDNKYQTEPWIFLGLTALSFVISCVGIVRITIKYTKKIESELKEKQDANNSRKTHE
jgi:F0F1-type ATP synthase assembly protein I